MEQNIEVILNTVQRLEQKLDSCVLEIKILKEKVKVVEDENKQLLDVTKRLEQHIDKLENQSRRNNIILYGVEEIVNENWDKTEEMLINVIHEKLGIDLRDNQIERAHRLGYAKNMKRPIIAKLTNYKTKEAIIRNAKLLKNSTLAISEDFSKKIIQERSRLKPLIGIAKQKGNLVHLSYNKIAINGRKLTYEEAWNLLNCDNEPAIPPALEMESIDLATNGAIKKKVQPGAVISTQMERPRRKMVK